MSCINAADEIPVPVGTQSDLLRERDASDAAMPVTSKSRLCALVLGPEQPDAIDCRPLHYPAQHPLNLAEPTQHSGTMNRMLASVAITRNVDSGRRLL